MNREYTFEKDGTAIKIPLERWAWSVTDKDGNEFVQFDKDGKFHQFKEVDQSNVKVFTMFNTRTWDSVESSHKVKRRFDIMVDENTQIFHLYRNIILRHGTNEEKRVKVYVFGWKNKETGAVSYNYILPDDRIINAPLDIQDMVQFNIE